MQASLQFSSQLSLAHGKRNFRVSASTCSSHKPHWLKATRFAGLRRDAPPKRLQQRQQQEWWQLTDRSYARGLGLKPVLAGLSGVPEGNLGLYDPSLDKDACGVGFVAELSAKPNRKIVSVSSLNKIKVYACCTGYDMAGG